MHTKLDWKLAVKAVAIGLSGAQLLGITKLLLPHAPPLLQALLQLPLAGAWGALAGYALFSTTRGNNKHYPPEDGEGTPAASSPTPRLPSANAKPLPHDLNINAA